MPAVLYCIPYPCLKLFCRGLIGLVSWCHPNLPITINFIPMTMQTLAGIIVAVDVFGLIRGWTLYGHVAHLGGMAAGVLYAAVGSRFLNSTKKREYRLIGK